MVGSLPMSSCSLKFARHDTASGKHSLRCSRRPRPRRARADERQQLSRFLFAAVPAVVCLSVLLLQSMVYTFTTEFLFNTVEIVPWELWNYILYVAAFALLIVPVFTYIAILKYRLYDIDVVINRTSHTAHSQ